jgi:hypothetical protein
MLLGVLERQVRKSELQLDGKLARDRKSRLANRAELAIDPEFRACPAGLARRAPLGHHPSALEAEETMGVLARRGHLPASHHAVQPADDEWNGGRRRDRG